MSDFARIIFIGIGATLVMDAWAFAGRHLLSLKSLDYRLVGRWIGYFPRGRFLHDTIAQSEPVPGEKWLGWTAHYLIGIGFAWLFVRLVDGEWFAHPRPEIAILFGLVSVVVPLFIMQPAFGFGIAASRSPDPLSARLRSLVTHSVFGLGLYLSAVVLAAFG